MTTSRSCNAAGVLKRAWNPGEALNRWNVTPPEDRPYPGTPSVLPDQVTYEFENGWVATGDLPCRRALRQELPDRIVTRRETGFSEVYLGSETLDVDYSGFCRIPTLRRRYARSQVSSETVQTIRLEIATAGSVHVWAGAQKVCVFEPYDRNRRHATAFDLELQPGLTPLTVMFEDLHERDTIYAFRLTLLAGDDLSAGVEASIDTARLDEAVRLLEGLRTTDVFYESTEFALTSDAFPDEPVGITVLIEGSEPFDITLSKQDPVAQLAADAPGCHLMTFEVRLGNAVLTRRLGTTLFAGATRLDGATQAARKAGLLGRAKTGLDIIGALATLKAGRFDELAADAMEDALVYVEKRKDCADFRVVTLLWIWRDHRNDLPEAVRERLKRAILEFRYWLDEPGNDVMWFWSENHVLCFHASHALAGQLFPDETFTASGRSGREMQRLGETRLGKWFDGIEQHGLAEWNSAAYYPINFRALLVICELSGNDALKQRARDLLNRICAMVALHYAGGVPAGTQGRIYEKQLLAGPMTELGPIAAVLFGGLHVPGLDGAAVLLALSSYAPPDCLAQFADPAPQNALQAHYCQGLGKQARLALWKTGDVQLSSVEDHKSGTSGHQQHVVDMQFSADPLARIWVSHPGDRKIWGDARPSYWAGNGRLPRLRQWGRHVLMVYELACEDLPFTHAFVPQDRFEEVMSRDGWIFARSGNGYAALYAAGGSCLLEEGVYAGTEWRSDGPSQAWILVAGNRTLDGDFESFCKARLASRPGFENGALSCSTGNDSLSLPAHGPFRVNGEATDLPAPSLHLDPQISVNGAAFQPWSDFGETPS